MGLGGAAEVDGNSAVLTGNEIDRALQLLASILAESPPAHWEVTLDGRDLSGEYLCVEAMNIKFLGPNVPLAPAADPGDGLLDVVLLVADQRDAMLDYLWGRLHGSAAAPSFTVHRGERLRFTPPGGALHVDDDLWGDRASRAPVSARAARAARRAARWEVDVSLDYGAVEVLVGAG